MQTLFNIESSNDLDYTSKGRIRDYKVYPCNINDISNFIEYWHYSENVNGIISDLCFKLQDKSGYIIGGIIYGKMAMANAYKKYVDNENDIIELRRLCCVNNTPKNTESYFIGQTIKWIRQKTKIKFIISYADIDYNHKGTIYKTTNFEYLGKTPEGRVIKYKNRIYHDKSIRTKYRGRLKPFANSIKEALKTGEAYYIKTQGKHIYLYDIYNRSKGLKSK